MMFVGLTIFKKQTTTYDVYQGGYKLWSSWFKNNYILLKIDTR